jgi:putative FmdB family regulatory protein
MSFIIRLVFSNKLIRDRRYRMPIYDFECQKCNKPFTLFISISEHEKKNFKCPECGSTKVEQQISPIQVLERWNPVEDSKYPKKTYSRHKKK